MREKSVKTYKNANLDVKKNKEEQRGKYV